MVGSLFQGAQGSTKTPFSPDGEGTRGVSRSQSPPLALDLGYSQHLAGVCWPEYL